MCEQGRSTLPTGEDGRILDRLAGAEKVIPPSLGRQVLPATGRVNGRACELTHEVMMWVVLAMRLLYGQIPDGALLSEDRGFFCYEDWKTLYLRTKMLVRVTKQLVLKPLRTLSDGSYLAKIYPNNYDRNKDRNGIVVRVIRYTLDDPQRKRSQAGNRGGRRRFSATVSAAGEDISPKTSSVPLPPSERLLHNVRVTARSVAC